MAASTKRLLKERTSIARNPIPYVTFADDDNSNDDDGHDDTKMADASSSSSDNISQWRFILTLDPIHDSLEDSSEIGKAAESPYCCAPSSSSSSTTSSTGKSKGAAALLAGVTRAASSRASKKSSSNDTTTTNNNSSGNGASSSSSTSAAVAAYFAFQLDFPATYPFKPPQITVLGPSYHPNIKKSTGEICDAVLTGDEWGPTLNIRQICARLRKFLCEPDAQHPLEAELGQLLSEKPGEYQAAAYKFAREFASDRTMVEKSMHQGGGVGSGSATKK